MHELSASPTARDADLRECLEFAFELTKRARREIRAEVLESLKLFVPVGNGWISAPRARFGAGWSGPDAPIDSSLVRLVAVAGEQSLELADVAKLLVPDPAHVLPNLDADDHAQLRTFLESLGVRHGLWPVAVERPRAQSGTALATPLGASIDGDLPLAGFTETTWRALAERWPGHGPLQTSTRYAAQTNWFVLPGQADFEVLDEEAQRIYSDIVVHGLGHWPSEAFEVRYSRKTDPQGAVWPTPLSAFLSVSAWVPQATPGDRSRVTRSKPSKSWWLAAADTVDFLPSQPARLRAVDTEIFHRRICLLGVRIWDDPSTAQSRLDHLAMLVRDGGLAARTAFSIRRAVETAWGDLVANQSKVVLPETLIVQSQGALTLTTPLSEDAAPIYVADIDDVRQQRLLEASPVLVLPIKDFRLGKQILAHLSRSRAQVRSMGDARTNVLLDGVQIEKAPRRLLLQEHGPWLITLVVAAMELKYRSFPPLPPNAIAVAIDRIERAELSVGQNITIWVDDHLVMTNESASLVVSDDATDVLVVGGILANDPWQVLDTAADSIAQLIAAPSLGDTLRVAFTALRSTALNRITVDEIAQALRLSANEVRTVVPTPLAGMDVSATVFALMCLEPSVGYELHHAGGVFIDDVSLREWLAARLSGGVTQASKIMKLSERTDRGSMLLELDAHLPTLNGHLRKVQLAELENAEAQRHQYSTYLQANGVNLRNQLRDRFADTARRGGDLSAYVQSSKEILSITPNPTWVTDLWTLDADHMVSHVTAWLDRVAPTAPDEASSLPDVDTARLDAQRRLRAVLGRLPILVEAWTHKNGKARAPRAIEVTEIVEAITATGRLDFGPLAALEVVDWLRKSNRWPLGMPPYSAASELDITKLDLEKARERLQIREAEELQTATTLAYRDEIFTAENNQLNRLFEEVRSSALDEAVSTPPAPVALEFAPVNASKHSRKNTRSTSWQASGPTVEKAKLIGLIGETIVGRWIEEQFGLALNETWVSGYRQSILLDGIGNDSLGYDYRVETPSRTLLLEVKASLGNENFIQLGESEVRRAQNLAPNEEYRIIFVANAGDATQARIHPLPNPFAPGGLQHYKVVGHSMSFRFNFAKSD